ncbi:peptidoglycan-binding protein [Streptomyces sp. NPDC019937]|uniref:peptidoglycan-binding protein n=1 Tax=Streptomyces sp. NPDC019937 TaxID=3154787 RepID=UPI0033EAE32D
MTGLRDEFVNLLRSQVGYHEGRDPDGDWNNIQKYSQETPGLEWSDGQAWCATFECWGAHKTGLEENWPMTASCWTAVQWWRSRGRFTAYPVLGGPLYMGPGGADHTEIVYRYDADQVWSVGGNTNDNGSYQGDGVYEHVRPRRGPGSPYGYGVPAYPEGTVSADPALGGTPTASVAVPARAYEPFPGAAFFMRGDEPALGKSSPVFTAMGKRLVAVGCGRYKVGPGPKLGQADVDSYEAWQRKCGYSGAAATWPPGKTTWDKLRVPKAT